MLKQNLDRLNEIPKSSESQDKKTTMIKNDDGTLTPEEFLKKRKDNIKQTQSESH